MAEKKPAIIVISSHVVRGTVGNRAAAFALEVLGHPVWAVPTITLPWHPGHTSVAGIGQRIVPADDAFARLLENLATSPWIGEVGAVLSGYLGGAGQVAPVARLVDAVKASNRNALFALDPVMGDNGRLYVPQEQARAIRDQLLPRADIATPNPFELGQLSGCQPRQTNGRLAEDALDLGVETVLVTSARAQKPGHIANLLVQDGVGLVVEHPTVEGPANGLGDLTSALFLGNRLAGHDPESALLKTTASVLEAMEQAAAAGADELILEASTQSLTHPQKMLKAQKIA